ncbi:MAG: AAA family ATPase [Atopobiaceae bacterium]|nr:AAA family ATPase [Atopobiaceae bacterium]
MLIRSITVENFLPFQGEQSVEFSTDPDRNVTLVMGDNGAGKTSLAQAFEWCLYGRAPRTPRGSSTPS